MAVIKIKGTQFIVREGDEILVPKLDTEKPVAYETILHVSDGNVIIGKPNLPDIKLNFKVKEASEKGDKIRVFKYKSKSRYRKTKGFRAVYTKLLVDKIS